MIMLRKTLVAIFAVILLSSGASLIQAQTTEYRGTFRTVRQLVVRLDNRAGNLRNNVQTALATNNTYNNNREENINNLAQEFDSAATRLRTNFDSRRSTTADAQAVLDLGSRLDRRLRRNVLSTVVTRNWNLIRNDLTALGRAYNVAFPMTARNNNNNGNTYPGQGQYGATGLTGTYRLDVSRSDNVQTVATTATRSLPYNSRNRVRDSLVTRLESPDQLAIDVRGREVTLASSRAPQISFTADGVQRVETMPNGRQTRASATLNAGQLIISSTGDRTNEFNVTFNPIDNGSRLSVSRRVYVEGLSRPVIVQSVYQRTSDVASFNINNGSGYPTTNTAGTDFIVPNGQTVVAVLNDDVSTSTAREGDRISLTVRQPSNLDGATIEGRVTGVQRSGRVTGRSEMNITFDTIRLRNGSTHRFAGILESVRNAQGNVVNIDNEGAVRDDNRTNTTVQRTAIGTAVGAIIGAIAGGGKGAAIGAIVGAGGGAGSVYVQGRDDLELLRGSELTIRSTGPR